MSRQPWGAFSMKRLRAKEIEKLENTSVASTLIDVAGPTGLIGDEGCGVMSCLNACAIGTCILSCPQTCDVATQDIPTMGDGAARAD